MPPPFVANLLLFGRLLERAGLQIDHGRLIDAIRALEWIGVSDRADVRATLAALLIHRHDDLASFDTAFDLFFQSAGSSRELGRRRTPTSEPGRSVVGGLEMAAIGASADTTDKTQRHIGAYSPTGVSRTKDFAEFTATELEVAGRLLAHLPWHLGVRTTRRWQRGGSAAIDLRSVLRRSLTRGELLILPRRRRRRAPRPIVLIGDVSGSMKQYSRMLLSFVSGLSKSARQVESFVFATRLTRITRSIRGPAEAQRLGHIVRDIEDWGGGTRIGDAIRTFNTRWARRVMRNRPVLMIVSDGWDRGDPEQLAQELARLRRNCRRLIWLNPLLGSPGYEPLTRGMQAALRHVDDFLPAHNLVSLEQLAAFLSSLPAQRRQGD